MRSGAYIQIHGIISYGIEIKHTLSGVPFGFVRVSASKGIAYHQETKEVVYANRRYPAFIWDKELLKQAIPLLKKGKKVHLSGELDYIPVKTIPSSIFIANAPEDGLLLIINVTGLSGTSAITREEQEEISKEEQEYSLPPEVVD